MDGSSGDEIPILRMVLNNDVYDRETRSFQAVSKWRSGRVQRIHRLGANGCPVRACASVLRFD
jgi:hypothetical protein